MTIELTTEQEALISQIARRAGVDEQTVVRRAIRQFLDHDAWFADAVEHGREDVREGRVVDHAEVVRRIDARLGR